MSFKSWSQQRLLEKTKRAAFVEELAKLSYSPSNHVRLANIAADHIAPKLSPGVRDAIVEGARGTDYGLRFPLLPWTDQQHSFPTQSKEQVHKNIESIRREGVKDLAAAIASEGTEQNARAYRGLKNIGEGSHMVADLGAHYEKPAEMGAEMPRLRKLFKLIPGGYGGGLESEFEHLKVLYHLDHLDPKQSATDLRTVLREKEYGRQVLHDLQSELHDSHGLARDTAKQKVKAFLSSFNPTVIEEVVGEGTRSAQYVARQAARAGRSFLRLREKTLGYSSSSGKADDEEQ